MSIKKDNNGMSLVELMVATAILSIVMLGVGFIMVKMSDMFSTAQREVQLQDNVQTTYSILSNLIKESQVANRTLSTSSSAGRRKSVISDSTVSGDDKRYYIFDENIDQTKSFSDVKRATETATYYIVDYDSAKKNLYLFTGSYNPKDMGVNNSTFNESTFFSFFNAPASEGVTDVYGTRYNSGTVRQISNLLAKNVSGLTIEDHLGDGYVTLFIQMQYGKKTADITQNIYLRNSNIAAKSNAEPEETEETEPEDEPEEVVVPVDTESELDVSNKGTLTDPMLDKSTIGDVKDIVVRYGDVEFQTGTTTKEWNEQVVHTKLVPKEVDVDETYTEYEEQEVPKVTHEETIDVTTTLYKHNGCFTPSGEQGYVTITEQNETQWSNEAHSHVNVTFYTAMCSSSWKCTEQGAWDWGNKRHNSIDEWLSSMNISVETTTEPMPITVVDEYETVQVPVTKTRKVKKTINVEEYDYTEVIPHSEEVPVYGSENMIVIQNNSLDKDYTGVEVIVYFKDENAYFKSYEDDGNFITVNTNVSTGSGTCDYYVSPDGSGKAKYLKIVIPRVGKATKNEVDGEETYVYDQYAFNVKTTSTSGKPVLCTYSVRTTN